MEPAPQSNTAPSCRSRIAIDGVGLRDVPANFHVAPGMPVSLIAGQVPGRHPGFKFFVARLARRLSAKQSGSFVGDDKLAFMSPSDDDYDQQTDPRTHRAGRETAGARGPAGNPQLNELQ
jgi:hypothetical protein